MGKYNLGKLDDFLEGKLSNNLFISEEKAKTVELNIENDLSDIKVFLANINNLLNKSVNLGMVKGNRKEVFKAWAKKAKSQANSADKLKEKVHDSYLEDLKMYPIKELDEKISRIEKRLAELEK